MGLQKLNSRVTGGVSDPSLTEREVVRRYLGDPIVTMESPDEKTRHTAGVTKMNILPDGTVTPCVFIPFPYGNVRKETLKNIWKRMAEFNQTCKPAGKCPLCDLEFREKLFPKNIWAERSSTGEIEITRPAFDG